MFRFATPLSADMHLGNLRVALFTYICASQANDKLHIRIEDSEIAQDEERKDQETLEMLSLFGINYADVTYQSHNLKFHQQLATKLLMDKNAFSCFCAPKTDKQPYDGRCENLKDEEVLNNESPFSVRIKGQNEDSFVILHVDKTPTHHFAAALDDLLSDISLVIQEEERGADTTKQIMIRDYLGYDKEVTYHHLPAIENGDITVKSLLEDGFLPSAIANYLLMIGHETPTEIFDIADAIAWFDLSKVSQSPITFDMTTLRHINRAHIKKLPSLELAKFVGYSSKDLGELAKIYAEEDSTINEIKPKIDAIFAKKESSIGEEASMLIEVIKKAPFFKEFADFKTHLKAESGLEEKQLDKGLRFLLTGAENGPDLGKIYPHIKNYLGEIIK